MMINKSQGQFLKTARLDLRVLVFSHGQLYVALSRMTNVSDLTVLLFKQANSKITNIVYSEVFEFMREDQWILTWKNETEAEKDEDNVEIKLNNSIKLFMKSRC